jgi:hypothetical protein
MLGWIEHWFAGPVKSIYNDIVNIVHSLIRGIYGFFHDLHVILWYAWDDMYNGANLLWKGLREFAGVVYQRFIDLYRHVVPYLATCTA